MNGGGLRKRGRLELRGAWLALALAGVAWAARAEEVRFFAQPVEIPERGVVSCYALVLGTNKFTFFPPPRWTVKFSAPERRCSLAPPDLSAAITIQVRARTEAGTNVLSKPALRQELDQRFPGARLRGETPCCIRDQEGVLFELERTAAQGQKLTTRLAFVPCPGALLEFSYTAASAKVGQHGACFRAFLSSFGVEPGAGAPTARPPARPPPAAGR